MHILAGKTDDGATELTCLWIVLCKHGMMEGEIRVRAVKDNQLMGAMERYIKGEV